MNAIAKEAARRRTFAIISHPDAGKTTLTEKFLLYGGALHLAGSVSARKNQRAATSDWMELERKRGISITSTVLQFEYDGYSVNLLDTPGHKDFSEDTYRVLTAVDSVVMVIDAAKGIEAQTRKLFEICRRRGIPIFTYINKCDRPTLNPIALMDELESVLGIPATAMVWPLGNGPSFKGVFDRLTKQVHLFERVPGGAYRAPVKVTDLAGPEVREKLDDYTFNEVNEQLAMLEGAGHPFDLAAVHAGKLTPVFFGSAVNNFGVQLMLDSFLKNSVGPAARIVNDEPLPIDTEKFSGFVFKIQANMDPKHRDRIAFVRVCSGRFVRDMTARHSRTGKTIRLSNSHKLFAQDRETANDAYPGDILGLVGHNEFGIGDTLAEDGRVVFNEIPRFPPECFAYMFNPASSDAKKFRSGIEQLLQEGVVQTFTVKNAPIGAIFLAAVGPLQFEVVQFRIQSEYNAVTRLEPAPFTFLKWLVPHPSLADTNSLIVASGVSFGSDRSGDPIVLFPNEWTMHYFREKNPQLTLLDLPDDEAFHSKK